MAGLRLVHHAQDLLLVVAEEQLRVLGLDSFILLDKGELKCYFLILEHVRSELGTTIMIGQPLEVGRHPSASRLVADAFLVVRVVAAQSQR